MQGLSMEQKKFATDNYPLIIAFIKKYGLDFEEYYDIVAIAFTESVLKFKPEMGTKFSPYFYRHALNSIHKYYAQNNRQKRKADTDHVTFSDLEAISDCNIDLILPGINFDCPAEIKSIAEIAKLRMTEKQKNIFDLLAQGYSTSEIWHLLKMTRSNFSRNLSNIRFVLKDVLTINA